MIRFDLREHRVSGHLLRVKRRTGDRWVAHWRDAAGAQHKRVLGRAWSGRGRPVEGYLTKQRAQRALDELLVDARRATPASLAAQRDPVLFSEAAEEWLRYIRDDRQRRKSTLADYQRSVRQVFLPAFGDAPLGAITVRHIDQFREALVRDGRLSARTINKYLALLHAIFKRAQRVYGLTANPAAAAERQPQRRSGDFNVLTIEEVQALVRAAASQDDAALYLTAAYAGLRLGELRALRWRDIDFTKRLVHVRGSYVLGEHCPPKSGRVRSVPLIDEVARALDGLSRRERFTTDEEFVFAGPLGGPFEDSALRRRYYAALKHAGLKHLRFHDLRHSFGTLAVQAFPLSDVKAYMGHADIATTMIYVHHVPRVDAAERLSAVVAAAVTDGGLASRTSSHPDRHC